MPAGRLVKEGGQVLVAPGGSRLPARHRRRMGTRSGHSVYERLKSYNFDPHAEYLYALTLR